MAVYVELDAECEEAASVVFDLSDSNAWLRAECVDGAWVVTLRDDDAKRSEVAFEADELGQVIQTLGALVTPAEHPVVTILRALPGQAEFLVRLCGADPDEDLEPLLDGFVTSNLEAAAKRNLGVEL